MMAGAVGVAVAWWIVMRREGNPFTTMAVVLVPAAALSVALGKTPLSPAVAAWKSAAVGLVSGSLLYGGTALFVRLALAIPTFESDASRIYGKRAGRSLASDLLLGVCVVVVCEELFWRGLFQGQAGAWTSLAAGAFLTWVVYVVANAASLNLAITVAAAVGGGLWVGLAYWSRGCLASILSHMVWTAGMLALPPMKEARR
jgi:membrane protease YdiL (CAAX protease family)